MTDIETELREAMAAAVADSPLPVDPMDLIHRGRRRHAARAAIASAAAVGVVIAAASVAGALSTSGRPAPGQAASAPTTRRTTASPSQGAATTGPAAAPTPPGWVRHADGAGDFIYTPPGWHVGGLPALAAPAVRWVIGTGPVPDGGSCAPTAALRKLPARGVLLAVMEYIGVAGQPAAGEPYTFPPRANRLGLGPLGGPFECWGVQTHLMVFQDGGRYFQVQTVFGPKAPAILRAQALQSLNTLRIAPLPSREQPAALCRAGRWTFCPQAVWVYHVISAARVLELGNLGTRAISGLAGNRSFGLWTTKGRTGLPGGRCRIIFAAKVCRAGNRLGWRVHGLVLWLEPAASPYATRPVRPGLPPDSALQRLVEASEHVDVAGT